MQPIIFQLSEAKDECEAKLVAKEQAVLHLEMSLETAANEVNFLLFELFVGHVWNSKTFADYCVFSIPEG
jgi:hypothetical protein